MNKARRIIENVAIGTIEIGTYAILGVSALAVIYQIYSFIKPNNKN